MEPVIKDNPNPITLANDPIEALKEIASYLTSINYSKQHEVIEKDDDGESYLVGYVQMPEYLQGCVEIVAECERISQNPINTTDYMKILAAHSWALIPVDINHGDDASMMWVVVGYFMGNKPARVIGECWDEDKPHLAIDDALETIKDGAYAYKYEFKG